MLSPRAVAIDRERGGGEDRHGDPERQPEDLQATCSSKHPATAPNTTAVLGFAALPPAPSERSIPRASAIIEPTSETVAGSTIVLPAWARWPNCSR